MSRSSKCRRVCTEPRIRVFTSEDPSGETILLLVDELEALRLCDLEGLDQDDAAGRMGVSRGTFQRILYAARKSVAQALCEGRSIVIEGGNYVLSKGCCHCQKRCGSCKINPKKEEEE